MEITPELIIKIIGCLFGTIGLLIGVIWILIRGEVRDIKEKLESLRKSFSKIPMDFMSKEDCRMIHDAKNNKK